MLYKNVFLGLVVVTNFANALPTVRSIDGDALAVFDKRDPGIWSALTSPKADAIAKTAQTCGIAVAIGCTAAYLNGNIGPEAARTAAIAVGTTSFLTNAQDTASKWQKSWDTDAKNKAGQTGTTNNAPAPVGPVLPTSNTSPPPTLPPIAPQPALNAADICGRSPKGKGPDGKCKRRAEIKEEWEEFAGKE